MVVIDTNVLVRILTCDDEKQHKAAIKLFENNEVFIPDTVILETEWVLRYAYDFVAKDISGAFKKLLGLRNVHARHAVNVAQAIAWHEQGLDFADAMHLASSQEYENFYTFDAKFIKKAKTLSSCAVLKP